MMAVWQLMPIDLLDPDWEASSYRGRVLVRARSEAAARVLAAKSFTPGHAFSAGSRDEGTAMDAPLSGESRAY